MVGGAAQQLASDCRLPTPFVPLSGARRLNVSIRRNSWLSQLISQFQRLFLIQLIATEVVTAVRWMMRCCTLPSCSVVAAPPDVYPWPRNVPDCLLHCHAECHYTSVHITALHCAGHNSSHCPGDARLPRPRPPCCVPDLRSQPFISPVSLAPVDPLDTELGHPGSYPAAVTQEPRNLAHTLIRQ